MVLKSRFGLQTSVKSNLEKPTANPVSKQMENLSSKPAANSALEQTGNPGSKLIWQLTMWGCGCQRPWKSSSLLARGAVALDTLPLLKQKCLLVENFYETDERKKYMIFGHGHCSFLPSGAKKAPHHQPASYLH